MATWISDDDGNKCSVEYFGSEAQARAALASLRGCKNCINCSNCSYCAYRSGLYADIKIPAIKNIHQKVLAAVSAPGALDMSTWHKCATTHCRAGWVVMLAGEEGRKLEKKYNTELAASLIYRASSPLRVSSRRFYDVHDDAMADMQRLAALEAKNEAG